MEPVLAMRMTDFLTAFTLVTSFLVIGGKRLEFAVKVMAMQAVLLAAVATVVARFTGLQEAYLAAFLTLLVKAAAIPFILHRVIRKISVKRETCAFIGIKTSLVLAGILVILSFSVTPQVLNPGHTIAGNALPVAISLMLLGLFVMITRKLAVMQIIGLLMMENGLFLAGVGTTYGMPLVVELGIFLDILVGVLIMGVLAFKINTTFDTIDTHRLKKLKG
ncbi:MAG: hydrogenase [Bacillota bacterium]